MTDTKKILIADDEPNIVISLEFLMKREGFAVSIAVDGAELFEPAFSVDFLTGIVTLAEAPGENVPVTAGFEFHVPVRFDTALLSMTQTAFEAGEIPDIRLVEVFE